MISLLLIEGKINDNELNHESKKPLLKILFFKKFLEMLFKLKNFDI